MEIEFNFLLTQQNANVPMHIIKLQLCDPIKKEKFGDAMTGFCQVVQEAPQFVKASLVPTMNLGGLQKQSSVGAPGAGHIAAFAGQNGSNTDRFMQV